MHLKDPSPGPHFLPNSQDQQRLSAQSQYRFMDVHVAIGSDEGVRFYEGSSRERFLSTRTHRAEQTHDRHELDRRIPAKTDFESPQACVLYSELMGTIMELARFGLIHGDYNEFNILIKEEEDPNAKGKAPADADNDENIRLVPVIIDFPQMVSIDHPNAEMYFDRDVNCIKRYFQRKFHFVSDEPGPFFADAKKQLLKNPGKRLDVEVEASGFSRKMARELEAYMKEVGANGDGDELGEDDEDRDEEDVESGTESQEEDEHGDNDQDRAVDSAPDEISESSRRLGKLHVSEAPEGR